MRELKFRAWNKKRKRMYEVLHLHLDSWGGIWATVKGYNIIEDKDVHIQIQPKDIQVMQCTGLKDKNGKVIYEGDILSDIEEKPFYIEYSEERASFCFVDKFDPYGTEYYTVKDLHYEGLEIVGNIYQNPELLEIR